MSSVAENLLRSETVLLEARKHPIAPVRDSLPAAGLLLVGIVVSLILPSGDGFFGLLWGLLGTVRWAAIIVGILWIVYGIVVWRTAEFAVTSMRVLRYEGLLQRRSSETPLSAVTDVKLAAGFVGRSLGYGDLWIFTQSGAAGPDCFRSITNAAEFRNAMMSAMMNVKVPERMASRPVPMPVAPAPAPVVPAPVAPAPVASRRFDAEDQAARLVRLAELRDKGIISPEEFAAKKTEILARM